MADIQKDSGQTLYPGECNEAFPDAFTIPPKPTDKKPGALSEEQFKQFFEEGYVVVEELFTHEELEPVKDSIKELVEELAQKLYKGGKVKSLYKEYGLFERLTKLERDFPGANIILHKIGCLPQAFRDILANDRMLNIVEQILGTPEIEGNPVWNLRTKTPRSEAVTVPWHQDSGYFDNDSYKTMIVTAWIPLLSTNELNGTLQVIPRGHRSGKVAKHQCCWGGTWYVILEEDEIKSTLGVDPEKDTVILPVPYGGLILFSNILPHRSGDNMSKDIRWSLDLRWNKVGDPNGMFGMKKGVQLRSADPDFKVDWEPFNISRHDLAYERAKIEQEEFDTTIVGPWMEKWELVHMNVHTEAHEKEKQQNKETSVPYVVG